MGVTGLWRLIEPAGKPVPVETLENKVLSVDISIWLHQMVKGYQDAKGAPLPNAHLIGLFQRLCKLLYFRIKPVFVFDGAFPALKRETIAKRQDNKQKYNSESERIKRELAILLTKKTAIGSLLGKQVSPTKKFSRPQTDEELFKLPALPAIPQLEDEESESEDEGSTSSGSVMDLHTIDLESPKFKALPSKEKYDLLLELKETRKMNSWGKLNELPKKSDNFSDFQMQRLLKRRKVQECLEETEKEMGDAGMSLNELESLLNEEGIDTKIESLPTRRIASNNSTRYFLINDVKQAIANAKKKKEADQASTSKTDNVEENENKKDELEEDLEKAIKMSLECATDAGTSKTDDSWTSYMSDSEAETQTDSEEEDGCEAPDMTSAKAYIMQYCDFTNKAIDEIVSSRNKSAKNKNKKSINTKVDDIFKDINFEKSQIVNDGANLSSSDDEFEHNTDTDVDEVNTLAEEDSVANTVDLNETSVVILENPSDEVIMLDSTVEESPKAVDSKESIENQSEASDNDFEDVSQIQQAVAETILEISDRNTETDSSDNDFEEVPEIIESKPVVQLTLKMNEALEDDIFADVFVDKEVNVEVENKVPKTIENQRMAEENMNEDDDDLQKAIMMSLECVTDDNKMTVCDDSANKIADKATDEFVKKVNSEPYTESKQTIKEKPKSKTLESLNEILSAQSTKNNVNKERDTKPSETKDKTPITNAQLYNMVEEIQNELQNLEQEKGRLDRIGRNITEEMTKDAQELLQIFGIPYIVAPMEAEAQCAFLESINLTDGTITDDSDIWLFGGKTVYKNFFNQKKHVLQFLGERIEKSYNLSREQLVLLALLVGSDYTTGIDGVGPVTALEILASFPFNKRKLNETSEQARYTEMIAGLQKFKQWAGSGRRTDNTSLKKKLRNISLSDDFPSVRVVQAYLEPNVERSEDKFSWGELDITILRDYTKAKFGWSQNKLDEIIKPVLKRMVERKNQKSVKDYFKTKIGVQSLEEHMSKRVKAAVQRIGPETSIVNEDNQSESKIAGKRKTNKKTKEPGAGPSKAKKKKSDESVLKNLSVRIVSEEKEGKSEIDIKINKTDRFQEIIPQREKDKQSLLQNKMKAIELFRKTNIDKKKKVMKRKAILPKDKADLSDSSDSN